MRTTLCLESAIRPDDAVILHAIESGQIGPAGPRTTVFGIRNVSGEIYRLVECSNLGEFMKVT